VKVESNTRIRAPLLSGLEKPSLRMSEKELVGISKLDSREQLQTGGRVLRNYVTIFLPVV
jgi:hypothetical protein